MVPQGSQGSNYVQEEADTIKSAILVKTERLLRRIYQEYLSILSRNISIRFCTTKEIDPSGLCQCISYLVITSHNPVLRSNREFFFVDFYLA